MLTMYLYSFNINIISRYMPIPLFISKVLRTFIHITASLLLNNKIIESQSIQMKCCCLMTKTFLYIISLYSRKYPSPQSNNYNRKMQVQLKKKKFNIKDFASEAKGVTVGCLINQNNQQLNCICEMQDYRQLICYKCNSKNHYCLQIKTNRKMEIDIFQCAACINNSLDPIFKVRKVLIQSYIKIDNIFQKSNQITFQIFITSEQLVSPIQIRGLKPNHTTLSWPMQGSFFLNKQQQSFYELKPLMLHSNRKVRKEEYIKLPNDRLKLGKNQIHFRIPKIDKGKFTARYKYEQKGLFYISINSINKISPQQLVNETCKQRRLQLNESLSLLNATTVGAGVQITKTTLVLMCPYTKQRIKVPVRGKFCKHYSCVCLETLAMSHINIRLWTCPLCDCRINEPYVDLLIYTILKDNNKTGTDVTIENNGDYKWIQQKHVEISLDDDQQPIVEEEARLPQLVQKQVVLEKSMVAVDQSIQLTASALVLSSPIETPEEKKLNERKKLKSLIKDKFNNISLAVNKPNSQVSFSMPLPPPSVIHALLNTSKSNINQQKSSPFDKAKKTPIIFDVKKIQFTQLSKTAFRQLFFKKNSKRKNFEKNCQNRDVKALDTIITKFFTELCK